MLVKLKRPACRHSTPLTWQSLLPLAVFWLMLQRLPVLILPYFWSVPRKSAGQ